jgi:hypothetical protein
MSSQCKVKGCCRRFCDVSEWIDSSCEMANRGFGIIVWGVHPRVRNMVDQQVGFENVVVVVKDEDFYCQDHILLAHRKILELITRLPEKERVICESRDYIEGRGCWITISNSLVGGPPILNLQFSYGIFKKIYLAFRAIEKL